MIKKINFYNWRIMLMSIERIAEFEKVSLEQFTKDWMKAFPVVGRLHFSFNDVT